MESSISVIDPVTRQKSFTSAAFRIVDSGEPQRFWRVYDESIAEESAQADVDFHRAVVLQSRKADTQALALYRRALQRNPAHHQARARLVDMLFARKQYADVVALFTATPVGKTDAVVQYAESLAQTGDTAKAISTLESALQWGATGKPVYISLAGCYRRMGNAAKADHLLRQSEDAPLR